MTAPAAHAAVTIGQLPPTAPTASCPSVATDYLEPSVTSGGNLYVAKQAGTITSWSTLAPAPGGATFVLKVFRRTTDPDVYEAIAHSTPHTVNTGLNTVAAALPVRSGDMIGLNAAGPDNACTFDSPGDFVLERTGVVADGDSKPFTPLSDVRLNLSAVLAPSNDFTLAVVPDRKRGTATVTAYVSNPGVVSVTGKGVKSGRAAKAIHAAGSVAFQLAPTGKRKRKLLRTGRVKVGAGVTFAPTGGDPSTRPIKLKLRRKRL